MHAELAENTSEQGREEEVSNALTFMNLSGDITITWDASNDAKIKAMVAEKMKQGYSFFTMRKVVIDSIRVKRKIGEKGIDSITSLVIDDADFDKLVAGIDDKEVAGLIRSADATLSKRRGASRELTLQRRLKDPDEVIKAKQAVAIRPVVGG